MTPNRLRAIAFRWSISAMFTLCVLAPKVQAQIAATAINGVYNGTYTCAIGPRTLKLSLLASGDGSLTGMFTFYLPPTSHTHPFSYSLKGTFDAASGKFRLNPVKWEPPPTRNEILSAGIAAYAMVGMDGAFDPGAGQVAGKITSAARRSPAEINANCVAFQATRDQAESANGATQPVASPTVDSKPGAAAQSGTAITGVYTGTLRCWNNDTKLKFSLIGTEDNTVTGFLIFDPPPDVGPQGRYRVEGRYGRGSRFFLTTAPIGTPVPSEFAIAQVNGVYSPGSPLSGRWIAGDVMSPPVNSGCGFNATRAAAESPEAVAEIAQKGPAPWTAPAPPSPPPSPASPVTEQSAATARAHVTICREDRPGGLTGLPGPDQAEASGVGNAWVSRVGNAWVSLHGLPGPDQASGKAAASQPSQTPPPTDGDWIARVTQRLQEHAQERKWDILTPEVTENRICARTNVALPYKFDSGDAKAMRDRADSIWELIKDIPTPAGLRIHSVTIDPPPSPPSPAQVASAKAVAERVAALRAAPPTQLASKDLVRKSKAYWDAYQTDLIRQVFDGGSGAGMDSLTQFLMLFNDYVEMFSKSCRASLPTHHEAVTITQDITKRDRYGNVVSQRELLSATVEVDSRFAPYYREYSGSLTSSGAGLAGALGIMSGRVSANAYLDPWRDIAKFFETETCQSAAMRQLGENLLRAAMGSPSLQQDGATIAGAAAETDKSLPPGRFARLVDACNGFFRDPANGRFIGSSRHDTIYCNCLGDKYSRMMAPYEEYYYANDFKHRFKDQIAQPKANSTDPAWPQLNQAVDDCAAEASR